jgi:hypothetical protein
MDITMAMDHVWVLVIPLLVNWTIQEQLWDGEAKAGNELKTTCGK